MKYYSRLNVYKNTNGTNVFNPETLEAISYNWWIYLKRINNKLVFNNYAYSNTTRKHQHDLKYVLREKGINIDLVIEVPRGLQDLKSGIEYYQDKIKKLELAIAKPRSRNSTNNERKLNIMLYRQQIAEIQALMGE